MASATPRITESDGIAVVSRPIPGVTLVTLNRPAVGNAWSHGLYTAVTQALQDAAQVR